MDGLETVAQLCLVGAGNMGGAMLRGWLESGYPASHIRVIDPSPPDAMAKAISEAGVALHESAEGVGDVDLLIVAVKPQIMDKVLPGLASLVTSENALLSVAAGTTIAQLAAPFVSNARIIRAMPNTPSQVSRGVTVCVGNAEVSAQQKELVSNLLKAIGQVA